VASVRDIDACSHYRLNGWPPLTMSSEARFDNDSEALQYLVERRLWVLAPDLLGNADTSRTLQHQP
jgi:hypothetical protein